MESGDLKIFQAVAREGSVTKAAQKMNYVQSNVTARIQHLESLLGVPLFRRSNRGMTLTSAGENLLEYADKILDLLVEAVRTTQYSEQPAGPLRIGSIETIAATHLTSLLGEFQQQYPLVQMSLRTGASHTLVQSVLHDELDGAFVYGEAEHAELEQVQAFEEDMVLIANHQASDLGSLLVQPMLFFDVGCTHRQRAESLLKEAGIVNTQVLEFGTLAVILEGVSAGLGVSLLPQSSVIRAEKEGSIYTHMLPEAHRKLKVWFVYRRISMFSSALQRFIDRVEREWE